MSDYLDPFDDSRRNSIFRNAGFRVGALSGLVMWGVHLGLWFFFQGTYQGDLIAWVIQMFVYFFSGHTAAQQQFESQQYSVDALRGVQAAGSGAALVVSILVWIFILLRGIIRDALGYLALAEPIGFCCFVLVDVSIAMGLGSLGGKSVVNKYQP